MVKSIMNVRRSSICWRGRRTDSGRQKTRNHGYDVIVGGELFTDCADHPRKLVTLNPNSNQQAPDATSCCRWWDAYRKQLGLKDFSPKSQDAVACSRLRSVALYRWSWWYPSGNRPLQQYLGFTAGRWLWSVQHKADSLIAKFKEAGGTVREICMSRVTAIISALVICIIVCLSWAVNHYRDNAITYKAQHTTKMPENWSWRTRQLLTCRCVSVIFCARCKIPKG